MGPRGQYCISSLDSPFCSSHYIYDRATAVVAAERYRFIRKWPMSGALGHCRETWAHAPPSGHAVADKSGKSSWYNATKAWRQSRQDGRPSAPLRWSLLCVACVSVGVWEGGIREIRGAVSGGKACAGRAALGEAACRCAKTRSALALCSWTAVGILTNSWECCGFSSKDGNHHASAMSAHAF